MIQVQQHYFLMHDLVDVYLAFIASSFALLSAALISRSIDLLDIFYVDFY